MELWLGAEAETAFQLPVNPSELMVSTPIGNTTVQIQSKGDVSIIGLKGLRTISFSSFFPNQDYAFLQCARKKPKWYIKWIQQHYRMPIKFTATGGNISGKFLINSFTYGSNDGTGDVQFTLELMEYKTPATQKVAPANKAKSHTVKKGETLKSISKKYYKTSKYWRKIYTWNKKAIEKAAKKHKKKSSANSKGVLGSYLYSGTKLSLGRV